MFCQLCDHVRPHVPRWRDIMDRMPGFRDIVNPGPLHGVGKK